MGKKWKKMFLLLAAACMAGMAGAAGTVYAETMQGKAEETVGFLDNWYSNEDWGYLVTEDATIILKYYHGEGPKVLEIPAQISGKTVVGIEHGLFERGEDEDAYQIKTLVIPETVTWIGFDQEPEYTPNLEEIIVKEGNPAYWSEDGVLYERETKTLQWCPNGKRGSLTVPEGVEMLGVCSFRGCNLSELYLPESLRRIRYRVFEDSNLPGIVLPGGIETMDLQIFINSKGLQEVSISEGIKTISEGMFMNCRNLSNVQLPESLTSIEKGAFSYCRNLKQIVIPSQVEIIKNYAFTECDSLKRIYIPDSVKQIATKAFYKSPKVVIECSNNSYAKEYAQKRGIPYRIVSSTSRSKLGILCNGQSVKNAQTLKVRVNKSYTLQAVRGTGKAAVKWKSSNAKVAAVKNGKVTVKKAGKATITATALDGKKVSIKLNASKAAVKVTKVQATGSKTMKKGSSQALNLTITPASADNTKVSWKSSNTKIAVVDKNGKVTAKKKGTAVITATAKDGSKKKGSVKITVK